MTVETDNEINADKSLGVLMELYNLYAPEKSHGEPIVINFSPNGKVEDGDIDTARKMADGLRTQIVKEVAEIEQRNSKVVITPKL